MYIYRQCFIFVLFAKSVSFFFGHVFSFSVCVVDVLDGDLYLIGAGRIEKTIPLLQGFLDLVLKTGEKFGLSNGSTF